MLDGLPINSSSITRSEERVARLAILETLHGAPSGLRRLIRRHGSALAALDEGAVLWPRTLRPLPEGARALLPGDTEWPAGFDDLDDGPALAFAQGLTVCERPRLAVVGARDADEYGLRTTALLTRTAAKLGWAIVSGGARGIDAAAHRAALETGGQTLAVLGGGFERPYPAEHRELFANVTRQGTLLTEYPAWRRPRPGQFPERNRLIAALADAVLVVQARRRSGALATARVARDIDRPVLAVPGDICYRLSSGTTALIATGAQVVCGPEHLAVVLEAARKGKSLQQNRWPRDPEPAIERDEETSYGRWGLTPAPDLTRRGETQGLPPWLHEALAGGRSVAIDDIVARSGKATPEVLRTIVRGELEGTVERRPGGRVRLAPEV